MRKVVLREMGTIHVKGTHVHGTAKPVVCVTTGERFASCTDAAEMEGVSIYSISACCRGKQKYVKVNNEKRTYNFIKETPENCVDALAATLQEKLALLDKYSDLIAEREMEERRQEAEAARQEEERRIREKREKELAKLKERLANREEAYHKASNKVARAWGAVAQTKSEIRKLEHILYN